MPSMTESSYNLIKSKKHTRLGGWRYYRKIFVIVVRFAGKIHKISVGMKRSQERRQEFRTDNNGNCQVQEDNVKKFLWVLRFHKKGDKN